MRIVVAPDSFKGTVTARRAAEALARGWRTARAGDDVVLLPLADGGEGTVDGFAAAFPDAALHVSRVTGPDGRPVDASWLLLPDGTAVVELAESSGLPLMAAPDPLGASTLGLGEVLAAAAGEGARRIVVGLGGSASTDGGTGALRALGVRFLDRDGEDLPPGGGALRLLHAVEVERLISAPDAGVTLLCDVTAPLLGPSGAAHVFGPQKGATPDDVRLLDGGLARLAEVLGTVSSGTAPSGATPSGTAPQQPGMGAAGGTSFGLAALWGATLAPGARTVAEIAGLPSALRGADLVISGEGRFDATSLGGKVVGGVLELAAAHSVPVAIVAGSVADDVPAAVSASLSLTELAGSVESALEEPERWLEEAGRMLATGT